MTNARMLGVLLAGGSMLVVGSSVAATSVITDYPWYGGQAVRYGLGSLLLLAVVRLGRGRWPRLTGRELALLVALAATGIVGFNLFLLAAVERADPGAVGAIVGCVPIVLALAGPLQRREAPSRRLLIAALIVVVGAALAEGAGDVALAGVLLAIGAMICEALFSLLADPLLPRLGPYRLSLVICALSAATFLMIGLVLDGGEVLAVPTRREGLALLYLAVVVTAIAFVAWYRGIELLGVATAGLFAGLIPIGALLGGWIAGTLDLQLWQVAGSLLVGGGVAFGLAGEQPAPIAEETGVTPVSPTT